MVLPGRDELAGAVEVDETLIGSLNPGNRGRQRGRQGAGRDRRRVPRRGARPRPHAPDPERVAG